MLNFKSKTTRFFFDSCDMMLEREEWANDHIGDALWRTALAAIAYNGHGKIMNAICQCLTVVNKKVRFMRHPTDFDDDTSRDQIIMAFVALKKYHANTHDFAKKNLDFRISKKFTWQDAWFWAKEKYTIWRILSSYHLIGWWFEPSYSIHLFCWMLWSSGEKAPLLRWYLLKFIVPKENYLLHALLGVKEEIPLLKPMIDFRWQRTTPWNEGRYLTQKESEFNTLDLDVLSAVLRINREEL